MKAIILAAGQGTRLGEIGRIIPKCLLPVCGETLLDRTIGNLYAHGIEDILIITGHQGYQISGYVDNIKCLPVQYEGLNNICSLYAARDHLQGECLIIEADVIADHQIFSNAYDKGNFWAVDRWQPTMDGSYLEGGPIRDMRIIREPANLPGWKSCGVLKLDSAGSAMLKDWIVADIHAGNKGIYYDQVIAKHLSEIDIMPYLHGGRWLEIDTLDDLQKAQYMFRS